jgi:hypothetical protein
VGGNKQREEWKGKYKSIQNGSRRNNHFFLSSLEINLKNGIGARTRNEIYIVKICVMQTEHWIIKHKKDNSGSFLHKKRYAKILFKHLVSTDKNGSWQTFSPYIWERERTWWSSLKKACCASAGCPRWQQIGRAGHEVEGKSSRRAPEAPLGNG